MQKADAKIRETYSYIQENLNTTIGNLKKNEVAYGNIKDGLTMYVSSAKGIAGPEDLKIDGGIDPRTITGVKDMEILGASASNTEDIFNPNPTYKVRFTASVPGKDNEFKAVTMDATVSLKSFLATNPNYKTSEYAEYFAPMLYAQKDAYDRMRATMNPIEGSEGSYDNRDNTQQINNYISNTTGKTGYAYDDRIDGKSNKGNDYQWETIPIEKDGKQTMISYQVVSMGQNTPLGNIKNKDGQHYAPGAYYIKMKIPTSTGDPKVIFLKRPNGESVTFNSSSYAHFTIRDLILNNQDISMDEVDPNTKEVNYLTTDPTTIRGILNSQLSYNRFSKLEPVKIKDALGKEQEKLQAKELQFAR